MDDLHCKINPFNVVVVATMPIAIRSGDISRILPATPIFSMDHISLFLLFFFNEFRYCIFYGMASVCET